MEQVVGKSSKEHFSSVSDPRILQKTRHKLIDVIVIILCAVMAGADDGVDIAALGREKEQWLKTFLELPNGIPYPRIPASYAPTGRSIRDDGLQSPSEESGRPCSYNLEPGVGGTQRS